MADAYVSDASPLNNYGSEEDLIAGFGGGQNEEFATRVLVQFEPGVPAGSTVVSAALQLGMTHAKDRGLITLSVFAVNGAWQEDAVTWVNQPAVEAAPADQASVSADVPQTVSWEIAEVAQGWVDGTIGNHGLLLRGPESGLFHGAGRSTAATTNPSARASSSRSTRPGPGQRLRQRLHRPRRLRRRRCARTPTAPATRTPRQPPSPRSPMSPSTSAPTTTRTGGSSR